MDAAKTEILEAAKSPAFGNACPAMKSDIVKPMPASAPAPASCLHVYTSGFTAMPARTAAVAARRIPAGFPTAQPSDDGRHEPAPTGEDLGVDRDAGIGEREDRENGVARPARLQRDGAQTASPTEDPHGVPGVPAGAGHAENAVGPRAPFGHHRSGPPFADLLLPERRPRGIGARRQPARSDAQRGRHGKRGGRTGDRCVEREQRSRRARGRQARAKSCRTGTSGRWK